MEAAIHRRLYEELGARCPLQFLFKFEYQAQFDANGAEHELCSVFIGRCTEPIRVNRNEVLNWRWVEPQTLQEEMAGRGREQFTPWFTLEWARILQDHSAAVLGLG
jgi:isopentenyl-diphosphate delta-isomerase